MAEENRAFAQKMNVLMGSPDKTLITDSKFVKIPRHVSKREQSSFNIEEFAALELEEIERLNSSSKKRNQELTDKMNYYTHSDHVLEMPTTIVKRKQKPPKVDKFVRADKPVRKLYLCKNELRALPEPKDLQDEINDALGNGHKQHIDRLQGAQGTVVPVSNDNEQMKAQAFKEVYD
jgi:hypothetical protein